MLVPPAAARYRMGRIFLLKLVAADQQYCPYYCSSYVVSVDRSLLLCVYQSLITSTSTLSLCLKIDSGLKTSFLGKVVGVLHVHGKGIEVRGE